MTEAYRYKLFVTSSGPRTEGIVAVLTQLHAEHSDTEIEVEIINIVQDPDAADRHGILATPTLLRTHPAPARKIVGDLSAAALRQMLYP